MRILAGRIPLSFTIAICTSVGSVCSAADIVGLGAELPDVAFDVPATVLCRELPPADADYVGSTRLLEIELPVTVVVARGDVDRVEEVILQLHFGDDRLRVVDFSPTTQLVSEYAEDIEVKSTTGSDNRLDASLGGVLPVGGAPAHVTPSITAGKTEHQTATETSKRKAPKEAVVVSAAIDRRRGVYFKLRQSSQSTLEGEHRLKVTVAADRHWSGGELTVNCNARGERKWLFVKQRKVWSTATTPVELRVARHTVAKPVVSGPVGLQEALLGK